MEVVIPSGNLGDPTSLARENCFVEKNVGGSFTNLAPNLYTAAVLSVNPWVSGIQPHSFRCRWGRLRVDYAFQVNPWASGFGRTRFGAAEDAYGLTPPSKSTELQDSAAFGPTRFGAAEGAYGLTPPSKSILELQGFGLTRFSAAEGAYGFTPRSAFQVNPWAYFGRTHSRSSECAIQCDSLGLNPSLVVDSLLPFRFFSEKSLWSSTRDPQDSIEILL